MCCMKFADVSRNCQNIQSRDNPKRKFGDGAETVKISRLALSPNSSLGMDETFCLKYKLASSPNSSLGISTRPKLEFGDNAISLEVTDVSQSVRRLGPMWDTSKVVTDGFYRHENYV